MQALARELPPAVQLAAVDTACLLPMRLVRKAHEKAYTFRAATEGERRRRIAATYTPPPSGQLVGPAAVAPAPLGGLPPLPPHLRCAEWLGWQPLDAAGMLAPQLHQALLRCPGLDRSVPGVAQLVGGSRAGYERWERFRK